MDELVPGDPLKYQTPDELRDRLVPFGRDRRREIVARGLVEKEGGRELRSQKQLERLDRGELRDVAKRLGVQGAPSTKSRLVKVLAPVLGPGWWGLREALKKPDGFATWFKQLKRRPGNHHLQEDAE